ncbi:MAG TPA: hypothetical protein VLB82_08385 [Thermodesulfobacteriota bacterium]|nr:hypothetical protein [Thermodesulfobacteriota bacterium]
MKPPIGKVLLFLSTDSGDPSDCISWAEEALHNGFDSPSLRILAGLDKPLNSFEVNEYTTRALHELNIKIPSESEAVDEYASELVLLIIDHPERMRDVLKLLSDLAISTEFQDNIFDYYLLNGAYEDLDIKDVQYYWEGANKKNIEQIVLDRCKSWIEEYNKN